VLDAERGQVSGDEIGPVAGPALVDVDRDDLEADRRAALEIDEETSRTSPCRPTRTP
jgi:hypothetical protein